MTAINAICDEMNDYINDHGQLKRSTHKGGLLNGWHDLDNQFWLDLFEEANTISENTRYHLPQWIENDIKAMKNLLNSYGDQHENLLNPPQEDMRDLPKRLTRIHEDLTVKKCLWRTLMNIREKIYNPYMDIDLPNEDSSIGKLRVNTFTSLFERSAV